MIAVFSLAICVVFFAIAWRIAHRWPNEMRFISKHHGTPTYEWFCVILEAGLIALGLALISLGNGW
jgi:hypothetical protein